MSDKDIKTQIPARLRVSDKEIEISGSEEFVSQQISKLESLFTRFANSLSYQDQKSLAPLNGENSKKTTQIDNNAEFVDFEILKTNKYENAVAVDGDNIQVLTKIPGDSTKQRMINLILIYLYFKSTEGRTSIPFSELRLFCEKHAELDKSNFSKIMVNQKRLFLISDSKATLTVPGKTEAIKLLTSLDN